MRFKPALLTVAFALGAGVLLVQGSPVVRAQSTAGPVTFTDVSDQIAFVHETDGGDGLVGLAWFDFDNDGFLDLFITNGKGHDNGLFRNNGDGTFTDVAADAGVANGLGNSAVVAGDINNDGWADLFLSGEGGFVGDGQSPTKLYLNNGDGTFSDITDTAGVPGSSVASSAAFGDINNDGYLDLFVTGLSDFTALEERPNRLYLNNGDLTFTDISASAGVDSVLGGCATALTDADGDGLLDILVANCADVNVLPQPVELFHNNGDLTFSRVEAFNDIGITPEVAAVVGFPSSGGFWMAIALGDFDRDADLDLFFTNTGQNIGAALGGLDTAHALSENNGDGTFSTTASGIADQGGEFGWGASFADFDNDGYPDLALAGSFPIIAGNVSVLAFPLAFREGPGAIGPGLGNPGRVLMNDGEGNFVSGITFGLENYYTSGLAVGDFNNDGFPDIAIGVTAFGDNPGQPVLLQNSGNDSNWLTIKTVGTTSNRDGVGALVTVTVGGSSQAQEVRAGSSFLSMDSPWLTFGLGESAAADFVEVVWPSGAVDRFTNISAGQTVTLTEGSAPALGIKTLSGTLPDGGFAFVTADGDLTVADLGRVMRRPKLTIAITFVDGLPVVFVRGAPDFVNQAFLDLFPDRLPLGQILTVKVGG